MTTTITVNHVHSRISGLNINIMDILDRITSFYVEGYQYTKAFRNGWYDNKSGKFRHWDGKKHLITKSGVFPTGLLARITNCLDENDWEYEIIDNRAKVKQGKPKKIKHYKPRDYQQEVLNAAIQHERGMIRVGTGGGKTACAGMITAHFNVPSMIYVVGKDLLYQFHKEMTKMLGNQVGIIGDGQCDVKKYNICSIWTAVTAFDLKTKVSLDDEDWSPEIISIDSAQKTEIRKAIQNSNLAIYDEAHFIATDTIQSIFKAAKKCKYVFGMTGTNWRDDGADLLLESVCGKRIFNMPSSKLIEQGYLVPPKISMIAVPPWHEPLPKNYPSVYKNYITENDVRNGLVVQSARKLLEMGRRPLILVRYLSHGERIAAALEDVPLYFVNGDVDGETREEVKRDFQEGSLKCLIASSVFDIGVDIPCLDALILAGGGKSTVRTLQRIGRVIRRSEGKKDAIVVDFLDDARYLEKHSAARVAVYETEPSFRIKFPKGFDHEAIKRPKKIKEKITSQM